MRKVFFLALVLMMAGCGDDDDTVPQTGTGGTGGAGGSDGAGGSATGGGGSGGTGGNGGSGQAQMDASTDPAAESTPCGPTSCGAGQFCCDGTCGICAPAGTTCPLNPCSDGASTDATDAPSVTDATDARDAADAAD